MRESTSQQKIAEFTVSGLGFRVQGSVCRLCAYYAGSRFCGGQEGIKKIHSDIILHNT